MNGDLDMREIARVNAIMDRRDTVFVFGSNRAGKHGGGAAAVAHKLYGATWGEGEGLHGRSYAIPTMDTWRRTLTVEEIAEHVNRFLAYAALHPELTFAVTRVGCGIAGYNDIEIAPLFAYAPANCELPEGWR